MDIRTYIHSPNRYTCASEKPVPGVLTDPVVLARPRGAGIEEDLAVGTGKVGLTDAPVTVDDVLT